MEVEGRKRWSMYGYMMSDETTSVNGEMRGADQSRKAENPFFHGRTRRTVETTR